MARSSAGDFFFMFRERLTNNYPFLFFIRTEPQNQSKSGKILASIIAGTVSS